MGAIRQADVFADNACAAGRLALAHHRIIFAWANRPTKRGTHIVVVAPYFAEVAFRLREPIGWCQPICTERVAAWIIAVFINTFCLPVPSREQHDVLRFDQEHDAVFKVLLCACRFAGGGWADAGWMVEAPLVFAHKIDAKFGRNPLNRLDPIHDLKSAQRVCKRVNHRPRSGDAPLLARLTPLAARARNRHLIDTRDVPLQQRRFARFAGRIGKAELGDSNVRFGRSWLTHSGRRRCRIRYHKRRHIRQIRGAANNK